MVAVVDVSGGLIGDLQLYRDRGDAMPYSRNMFSAIVLSAVLVLAVPYFLVGGRLDFLWSMTGSWVRMFGLAPFGAGLILILWAAYSVVMSPAGSKTPAGPFRYTRNPIMLGVLLAVASEFLLYDWPPVIAYLVVLFVGADCVIRLILEPALVARHGDAYQVYFDSVPRWMPRFGGTKIGASPESS
jgi:protein-S-isoprenylcysteine O-methyltransferase Ste14